MNKLIIAVAVALVAVASNAAIGITWQTGSDVKDVKGNAFTGTTTGYTASILFSTLGDMSSAFDAGGTLTSTKYSTKGGGVGFQGATDSNFGAGTYYTQLVLTEDASGRTLTSDIASFSLDGTEMSSKTINFTSGANLGDNSLWSKSSWTGSSVPEPTSGLLLLLGVAGLALKRKQA